MDPTAILSKVYNYQTLLLVRDIYWETKHYYIFPVLVFMFGVFFFQVWAGFLGKHEQRSSSSNLGWGSSYLPSFDTFKV